MRRVRMLLTVVVSVAVAGCATIKNLDKLMTLQEYSNEQENIKTYVEAQKKQCDALVSAAVDGSLEKYTRISQVERKFGAPVYTKAIEDGGETQVQWVYRYATEYLNTPKVIFYGGQSGAITRWEYIPAPASK